MNEPNQRGTIAGSILGIALGGPGLLLALALPTGVGLARDLPTPIALASGALLGLLPILGLVSLLGRRPGAFAISAWLWALIFGASLPLYFPGQRTDATALGLAALTSPLGEASSERAAEVGRTLASWLGEDPTPPPAAVPIARAEEYEAPPLVDDDEATAGLVRLAPADPSNPAARPPPARIAYEGGERSMQIPVAIDGPSFGESFTMIFDTGATFTTLSSDAIARIGVRVPGNAPWVTLRTANGEVDAPLVLVDAVWLGEEVVEWVTVAVCDLCAVGGSDGLLGLNVSGQYAVALDHDRRRIEVRPRRARPNRKLDVSQWIQTESTATRFGDGRIEVSIAAENRAPQTVRAAVFEVRCIDQSFAVQLDDLAPQTPKDTTVSLPRGTDCSQYEIELRNAAWLHDRF